MIPYVSSNESSLINSNLNQISELRLSNNRWQHSIGARVGVLALVILALIETSFILLKALAKVPFASIKPFYDVLAREPMPRSLSFSQIRADLLKVVQYAKAIFIDTAQLLRSPDQAQPLYRQRGLIPPHLINQFKTVDQRYPIAAVIGLIIGTQQPIRRMTPITAITLIDTAPEVLPITQSSARNLLLPIVIGTVVTLAAARLFCCWRARKAWQRPPPGDPFPQPKPQGAPPPYR